MWWWWRRHENSTGEQKQHRHIVDNIHISRLRSRSGNSTTRCVLLISIRLKTTKCAFGVWCTATANVDDMTGCRRETGDKSARENKAQTSFSNRLAWTHEANDQPNDSYGLELTASQQHESSFIHRPESTQSRAKHTATIVGESGRAEIKWKKNQHLTMIGLTKTMRRWSDMVMCVIEIGFIEKRCSFWSRHIEPDMWRCAVTAWLNITPPLNARRTLLRTHGKLPGI